MDPRFLGSSGRSLYSKFILTPPPMTFMIDSSILLTYILFKIGLPACLCACMVRLYIVEYPQTLQKSCSNRHVFCQWNPKIVFFSKFLVPSFHISFCKASYEPFKIRPSVISILCANTVLVLAELHYSFFSNIGSHILILI